MTEEEKLEEKARQKARAYNTEYAEDSEFRDMISRPKDFIYDAIEGMYLLLKEKHYRDGYLDGYNKANEWHYPSKGEYPKEDCEVVILHENGKKNIQKWENGDWTNAIVIPVIAWKEIVPLELPKEIKGCTTFRKRKVIHQLSAKRRGES